MQRFGPLIAAVVLIAEICACLLWLGFEARFYAPIVFTFGGMMFVSALALAAVRLGHCRSPAAAFALGLFAGLAIQPGHHLVAYLADGGTLTDPAGALRHLDRRFSEVEINWTVPPRLEDDEDANPSRDDYRFLWAVTLLEILFIPLLCALPPWLRVLRNPYCETDGQWAERTRLAFLPQSEEALLDGLDQGRLAEVAGAAIMEHHPNRAALLGLLDVCPGPRADGVAGYLSLRLTAGDAAATIAMESLVPYHRLRLRCAELSDAEVEALHALIPEQATATVTPSWFLGLGDGDEFPAAACARLERVDQPHPPPAATSRSRRIAEALNLVPILTGLVVGFGLLFAAAELEDGSSNLAIACGISGFAVMLAGVWFALMDMHLVGDRYLMRRLAQRLARRPDAQVRPLDDDALRVAFVPRSVWSGGRGNELIDHGLLAVRDTVLYEGDRHRMRIPAASIQGVSMEPLTIDQLQTWYFVVLQVRTADGLHTLPFVRIAAPLAETLLRKKQRRSRVLFDRILGIIDDGDPPP